MKKKRREIPDWRRFELIVSSLERVLRPTQHVVRSPAHILDTETNTPREVDGCITWHNGNGEKQISIECRRRGTREDVTWIEQLATKTPALNLSGTIAVSSNGFSKTAHLKAKRHGITLKTFRELQLALDDRPFDIRHTRRTWWLLRFDYEVPDGCPVVSTSLQDSVSKRLHIRTPDTPILRAIGTGEVVTIRQIVENALA